uniref:Myosin tail domain-containing protein n=1 Tax=Dendroctonus ponderosae TaxID=77166 RepID=A0AAR5Q3V2_DENPD
MVETLIIFMLRGYGDKPHDRLYGRWLSVQSLESSYEIYATPRPLTGMNKRKLCTKERTACNVYRRLILLAWRRSREAARSAKELTKKQELQVGQLELQIDVLSKLRVAEGQKREEAQSECQKLKRNIEVLELENNQLVEETENLHISYDILHNELKVAKAENNFLSEQSITFQNLLGKKKAEIEVLEEKVRHYEEEISAQKVITNNLQKRLQEAEKNLKTSAIHYRIKENKYTQLKCEFRKQFDMNTSMSSELQSLKDEKLKISMKVDDLKSQLNDYIQSCEVLKDMNSELTQKVEDMSVELKEEKRHNWLRNTKHFALLSLSAFKKIAHVVIPIYLDGRGRF